MELHRAATVSATGLEAPVQYLEAPVCKRTGGIPTYIYIYSIYNVTTLVRRGMGTKKKGRPAKGNRAPRHPGTPSLHIPFDGYKIDTAIYIYIYIYYSAEYIRCIGLGGEGGLWTLRPKRTIFE